MKYTVNEKSAFESNMLENGVVLEKDGNNFRFLYKEHIYKIKVLAYDATNKTHKIKINGYTLSIKSSNDLDDLIGQLGFNKPPKIEVKEIRAPMPGLVRNIFINQGQSIKSGDSLFVLEAMKMENLIKSSGDGTVSEILVTIGDKVEKGSILVKL